MPVLTPGRPFSSRDAVLLVENQLAPGTATFALTVLDQAGNVSAPAQLRVIIRPAPPSRPPILEQPVSPLVRPIIQP